MNESYSNQSQNPLTTFLGIVVLLGLGIGLFFLILSMTIVGPGQVGVVTLFGKVKSSTLESGFHLVNPLSSVSKMDIKTQEYTMSIAQGEGEKEQNDSIDVLTSEGLKLALDVTVLYRLQSSEAPKIVKEIGKDYKEKIVRPEVRNAIREVASQYTAQELYSTKRDEYNIKLSDSLTQKLSNRGLILETILLRNIILPAQLSQSIEEKQAAEQESQKMVFVLEKEKQEAERKRVEAQGIRDSQEIIAQQLSQAYLQWYSIDMMKELANSQNTTFLFVPTNESGMPIVNINSSK